MIKKILVLFLSFIISSAAFSQRNPAAQKFSGVWELKGVRVAETADFSSVPAGFFKAFQSNSRLTNFNAMEGGSIATLEGRFAVTSDSTYEERIERTANKIMGNTTNILKYKFINNNNIYVQYKVDDGQWAEEHWRRITLEADDVMMPNDNRVISIEKDLSHFNSPLALGLKKGIKKSDIEKIENSQLREAALSMLNKNYNLNYRAATYRAILKPEILGGQLVIGDGYSKYENITGIYLQKGENLLLVDGIAVGKTINLLVPNWNRRAPEGIEPTKDPAGWGIVRKIFPLKNGVNIITLSDFDGLAYLAYFSDKPENEKPVQLHFVNAKVNGYFDITKHTDKDWNQLIDNAVYPVIDAIGRHIQIAYPAADCKKYAYGRGLELISNYDSLIRRQHRILGLEKFKRVPKNKILSRVNYNYYMFRDGDGVAYMGTNPGNAMPLVVDPARVIKGDLCWGFSHEVGHVHQTRPYFNWGGLGEVSNNVFSLYNTTSFGNKSRISEQKNYESARKEIIEKRISYLQDKDVFNRLVPFWQLQLYFNSVGKQPDFYPNLFEAFRRQGEKEGTGNGSWGSRGNNPAVYQLNFIKTACEAGKTDLTDFFDNYGFFYVGEFSFDDYGKYNYKMTKEMVDEYRNWIAKRKYPKPKVDISNLVD